MADRLKLALVGCGQIAQTHLREIENQALDIDVTALVDSRLDRAEAMAEQTGGEAYSSLEDALAKGDFDAVDLMLPHDLHVAAALASFAAGKHVVLEKPMAPDLNGCSQILQAAEKAGTVFMIAEQAQYWPDVHRAAELIQSGAIGEVIFARATFYDPIRRDPEDPMPWRFRLERSGGGICLDGGAHWIRPLRIWLGEIDEVIGTTAHPISDMEGESLVQAIFRFESGVTATFMALNTEARTGPGDAFRITGTEGELVIQHGREGNLLLFNHDHPTGEAIMGTAAGTAGSYGYELKDFASAVLSGTALQAKPEYSLGELRTALALYRSVESRTWEKVWD